MPEFIHHGQVAFHETDAAGIVHFSRYFLYAEEAETAALASLGIFSAVTLRHYAFPRVQATAQYNRPLRFPEAYTVRAFLKRIGNSSLTWHFEIGVKGQSCACVEMTSVRIWTEDGSTAPYLPQEKEILSRLLQEPGNALPPDKK